MTTTTKNPTLAALTLQTALAFLIVWAALGATKAHAWQQGPSLYSQDGTYLGQMNNNRVDPNSVSNPVGRYGSPVSPYSINNPVGIYGSQVSPQSPNFVIGQPYNSGYRSNRYQSDRW